MYIAYRTKKEVQGRYMVCILYESCLLLAVAESPYRYNVVIAAPLATATIEETDNSKGMFEGRARVSKAVGQLTELGLQCHTAPHTWKVLFESSGKVFELIFAACSATEERVWRDQLSGRIAVETKHITEEHCAAVELSSPLTNDLKSTGKAYGKAGGFIRGLSLRRTATLGPLSDPNQVIIKNTEALRDESANSSTSSLPIPRSQSVTTPSHVPTLAPMRQERMKVESMLVDVWTKDTIPFPGMGTRRSKDSIRDTANDLIRKLSMASIASNFSKRTVSYTGASNAYQGNGKAPKARKQRPENGKPRRPPLIDFHNAPDAFLPEDFELQDPRSRSGKGLNLRSFTMTGYERPRSPFFFSPENRTHEIQRSRSMRQQAMAGKIPQCNESSGGAIVGSRAASRQSVLSSATKPITKDAGRKERLLKFLGKVRPSEDQG